MRMSTRNQLPGTVAAVEHGGVMSTVKVTLSGGDNITVAITRKQPKTSDSPGLAVTVLVKATEVMLGVD